MRVGVPREIKTNENRVAVVPAGAEALTHASHAVLVEAGAGIGSELTDDAYRVAGATIVDSADAVWSQAEMIVKVKEPIAIEHPQIRPNLMLFIYFHVAASKARTEAMKAELAERTGLEPATPPDASPERDTFRLSRSV